MSATKDHAIHQEEAASRGLELWTAAYVGPSGTKGGRYRVHAPDGRTRTVPYNHAARDAAEAAIETASGGTVVQIDRRQQRSGLDYHVAEVRPAFNYGRGEMTKVWPGEDFRIKVTSSKGETHWMSVPEATVNSIRGLLIRLHAED